MYVTLTIARYPTALSWAGMLSMAIFRLPAMLNKKLGFYKLLGCGKNGTFDKTPDLKQWGILAVIDQPYQVAYNNLQYTTTSKNTFHLSVYGKFITGWWQFFKCETWTVVLEPIEGHGLWDGKKVFGNLPKTSDYEGITGVLTRATIRLSKMKSFWQNVAGPANAMTTSPGFITSLGVGEVPWVKQATFSVWQNKTFMKDFAYKMKAHAEVVKKTRQEKWYSEDMFTRFKVLASMGTLNGNNPLEGML